jgi:hypothetical protein
VKVHRQAHAARAGIIGLLECCRCSFPVERAATDTEHDELCPAHGMTLSARAAGARIYTIGAAR